MPVTRRCWCDGSMTLTPATGLGSAWTLPRVAGPPVGTLIRNPLDLVESCRTPFDRVWAILSAPATKKSCHLLNSVRALECGCEVGDSCLSFAPATLQPEGTMQREDGHGGINARGCRKLKLAATKGGVQRLAGRSESNTRNTRPDCERKLACSVGDNQDHTLTGHAELLDGLGSTNHPWVECQLSLAQSCTSNLPATSRVRLAAAAFANLVHGATVCRHRWTIRDGASRVQLAQRFSHFTHCVLWEVVNGWSCPPLNALHKEPWWQKECVGQLPAAGDSVVPSGAVRRSPQHRPKERTHSNPSNNVRGAATLITTEHHNS